MARTDARARPASTRDRLCPVIAERLAAAYIGPVIKRSCRTLCALRYSHCPADRLVVEHFGDPVSES